MKRRPAFKLFAFLSISMPVLWPTVIEAQTPQPAGVVSTLTGQASLAPAARPQEPRSLKFRDDLFFKDRISTKERSIVRVLLGGKAVVTVRELSNLTITEEPGRPSTVNLDAGKVSLGVARSRMGPGETIEVRTPNAIVAVRGTFLVVEVAPAPTAQLTPAPVVFNTSVYLFEGSADLFNIDRSSRVTVGALETVSVLGNTVGQVRPLPPTAATVILMDLKPPASAQHGDTPETVKQAVTVMDMTKVEALANALAPPPPTPTVQPAPTQNVVISTTGGTLITDITDVVVSGTTVTPPDAFSLLTGPPGFTVDSDSTIVLDPGATKLILGPIATHPGTSPILQVDNATINADSSLGLITFLSTEATSAGPVFSATNSTIHALSVAFLLNSTLTGSGTAAAFQLNNSTLTVTDSIVHGLFASRGSLSGPFLASTASNITSTFGLVDFNLNFEPMGSLISAFNGPFASLSGGTHAIADTGSFVGLFSLVGVNTSTQTVAGNALILGTDEPFKHGAVLLEAKSSAAVQTNGFLNLDTVLFEASAPLAHLLSGASMTTNNSLVDPFRSAKMNANVPSDALFKLDAATLTVTNGSAFRVGGGSFLNVTGSLFSLNNNSTLTISNGGLVSVSGGSVFQLTNGSLAAFGSGTNTLNVTNSLCSGTCPLFGSIPVALVNGATSSNISVSAGFNPFAGLGQTNTRNLSGPDAAVIVIDGPTSKVTLQ